MLKLNYDKNQKINVIFVIFFFIIEWVNCGILKEIKENKDF